MKTIEPKIMEEEECRNDLDESSFGSLSTAAGMLPLKALSVEGTITGTFHHTRVEQVFRNVHDEPLEATYIFPLPGRAGVTACRMKVGDRVIEGQLKERQQAREEYDQAIQKGRRAAIAEEERPEVFTLRLGNLMPGEEASIELELVGALTWDENEIGYRFPLVVAPRYIPGRPLDLPRVGDGVAADTDLTPDASRITPPMLLPGFPNPVRLDIRLTIDAGGLEIRDPRTSMPCSVETDESGRVTLRLQHQERLNRDFILRFKPGREADTTTDLVLAPDADGTEGTYCLTVVPACAAGNAPRDIILLLDRSGSMSGWKMVAARRAAARLIDSLESQDRFHVLAFDNGVEEAPGANAGLPSATDRNRFRCTSFLNGIEARGGTQLAESLTMALDRLEQQVDDRSRQKAIVLITDGQVGNEDHLLRVVGQKRGSTRIFTVGIDQAVNGGFLERLAEVGDGFCELVESEDRLDDVLDRIRRRLGRPAFQDAKIKAKTGQLLPDSQAPSRLSDAFPDRPWSVLGRYDFNKSNDLEISLAAKTATGGKVSLSKAGRRVEAPQLAATWARSRLRDLEDRYAVGNEDRTQLEEQITKVSLRHKVLCRFTAWLTVDNGEIVNEGGGLHRQVQPVEFPDGWGAMGVCAPPAAGGSDSALRRVSFSARMPAMPDMYAACSMDMDSARIEPATLRFRRFDKLEMPVLRKLVADELEKNPQVEMKDGEASDALEDPSDLDDTPTPDVAVTKRDGSVVITMNPLSLPRLKKSD